MERLGRGWEAGEGEGAEGLDLFWAFYPATARADLERIAVRHRFILSRWVPKRGLLHTDDP